MAAGCGGVLAWAGGDWLIINDVLLQSGAWLVNVESGERGEITRGLGVPGLKSLLSLIRVEGKLPSLDGMVQAA